MDRNQAKEFYPILQAYAEGKVIESRTKPSFIEGTDVPNDWTEMKEIEFWNNTEYRIKPDTKCRPFKDAEECWQEMLKHQPFGWLKRKTDERHRFIVEMFSFTESYTAFKNGTLSFSSTAFNDYTFADGTPFGMPEEE